MNIAAYFLSILGNRFCSCVVLVNKIIVVAAPVHATLQAMCCQYTEQYREHLIS